MIGRKGVAAFGSIIFTIAIVSPLALAALSMYGAFRGFIGSLYEWNRQSLEAELLGPVLMTCRNVIIETNLYNSKLTIALCWQIGWNTTKCTACISVRNAGRHLDKWRATCLSTHKKRIFSVRNAGRHLDTWGIWRDTCLSILKRRSFTVLNVGRHLDKWSIWRPTCLSILKRRSFTVLNVGRRLDERSIWSNTWLSIHKRRNFSVQNVGRHLDEWCSWRDTCLSTRRLLNVKSVTSHLQKSQDCCTIWEATVRSNLTSGNHLQITNPSNHMVESTMGRSWDVQTKVVTKSIFTSAVWWSTSDMAVHSNNENCQTWSSTKDVRSTSFDTFPI